MTDNFDEINTEKTENEPHTDASDTAARTDAPPPENNGRARKKLSGAYWYVDKDEETLSKNAFNRSILTVIALLLQMVVLLFPQDGLKYATEHNPSLAFTYMCAVFVMLGASVYVMIMNRLRYAIAKRIPVERAPKNGFKYFVYLGTEFFTVVNALLFIFEIVFVALDFDGYGLAGVFVTAAATAAAVWARMITHLTLKSAERVEAQ